MLLVAFVVVSALMSPLITNFVFDGDGWLTVAFIVAVAAYAPEYFRRGIFNGHRQPSRLGGQILAEAFGRLLIAAVLLGLGVGVVGPVIAILLAPIIGVLAIRPVPVDPPKHKGEPFSAGKAFRFTGPVLVCMACAQAFANGGPIIVSLLSGTRAQSGCSVQLSYSRGCRSTLLVRLSVPCCPMRVASSPARVSVRSSAL